jgi:hypothetical protein
MARPQCDRPFVYFSVEVNIFYIRESSKFQNSFVIGQSKRLIAHTKI